MNVAITPERLSFDISESTVPEQLRHFSHHGSLLEFFSPQGSARQLFTQPRDSGFSFQSADLCVSLSPVTAAPPASLSLSPEHPKKLEEGQGQGQGQGHAQQLQAQQFATYVAPPWLSDTTTTATTTATTDDNNFGNDNNNSDESTNAPVQVQQQQQQHAYLPSFDALQRFTPPQIHAHEQPPPSPNALLPSVNNLLQQMDQPLAPIPAPLELRPCPLQSGPDPAAELQYIAPLTVPPLVDMDLHYVGPLLAPPPVSTAIAPPPPQRQLQPRPESQQLPVLPATRKIIAKAEKKAGAGKKRSPKKAKTGSKRKYVKRNPKKNSVGVAAGNVDVTTQQTLSAFTPSILVPAVGSPGAATSNPKKRQQRRNVTFLSPAISVPASGIASSVSFPQPSSSAAETAAAAISAATLAVQKAEEEMAHLSEPSTGTSASSTKETKPKNSVVSHVFTCDKCSEVFGSADSLQRHEASRHRARTTERLQCGQCEMTFSTATNLARHEQAVHNAKGAWQCESCPVMFSSQRIYRRHLTNVHGGKKARVRQQNVVVKCPECDYNSKWAGNVNRHFNITHAKKQDFKCELCNRKFSTKSNLQTHMATHS